VSAAEPLLEVRDLRVSFRTESGLVHAVDRLSFSIALGEVLGIVGESGSGKTVSMLTVVAGVSPAARQTRAHAGELHGDADGKGRRQRRPAEQHPLPRRALSGFTPAAGSAAP